MTRSRPGRTRTSAGVATAILAVVLTAAVPLASSVAAGGPATSRVSLASDGSQGDLMSFGAAISADGRYVGFTSRADNLVPGDTNGGFDVFLHDRVTGSTTRVNVSSGGAQTSGDTNSPIFLSADGRYLAFESPADTLVAGDTNGTLDVFVHDRVTGDTTRESLASNGLQGNGFSSVSDISADGRYVVFESGADNLVPGDTGNVDIFVRDRVAGTTSLVSQSAGGGPANNGSFAAAISADGRFVSFTSTATNLVPSDTNGRSDVFVRDRVSDTTTRVSVANDGTQANGNSADPPVISADGRYVVFRSEATNLTADRSTDTLYVRDRTLGSTTHVAIPPGGGLVEPPPLRVSAISADGRFVAYSAYTDPPSADGDTYPGQVEAFVVDRLTSTATRVGTRIDGSPPTDNSDAHRGLSADGRYVAFSSGDAGTVTGDTNGAADVFVRDLGVPAALAASAFGDFTGDGWADLISRQSSTGGLYLNQGTYLNLAARTRIGTGWNSMSSITRFGDFGGDGHEDLIARQAATGALWLYPGNTSGTGFTARVLIGRSGWNAMREIAPTADLTGDGRPDLLAVQAATGVLYVYPGHGTSLGPRQVIGRSGWNAMSELTAVGDLNHDSHPDLIARSTATGELWLYPGTATGFGGRIRIGTNWNSMRDLVSIGDVNRDGFADLVAVQSSTGNLYVYPWRGTAFGARQLLGAGWTTANRPLL